MSQLNEDLDRGTLAARVRKLIQIELATSMPYRAKVKEISGNKVKLQRTGFNTDNKFVAVLESYSNDTPAVNDDVIVLPFGSDVIVLGVITT